VGDKAEWSKGAGKETLGNPLVMGVLSWRSLLAGPGESAELEIEMIAMLDRKPSVHHFVHVFSFCAAVPTPMWGSLQQGRERNVQRIIVQPDKKPSWKTKKTVEVCRAAFHFACMNSSQHQLERHLTLAPSLHL